MTFDWEPSDEKYVDMQSSEARFKDVLYHIDCPNCGGTMQNIEFDSDPDGPAWHYDCDSCTATVTMYPTKVRAWVSFEEY